MYNNDRSVIVCQTGFLRNTFAVTSHTPLTLSQIPQPASTGRRERKAMATRRALLDAGLSAFENTPLALISVQDITDAADVAKGVFYLHFRSRNDFLLTLWREVQEAFLDRAEAAMRGRRSLRSRLEALVRTYAEMPVRQPREMIYWMRMSSYIGDEVGAAGELLALRNQYFSRLAQLTWESDDAAPLENVCTLDACCWGILRHRLIMKLPPLSPEALLQKVLPILRTLGKSPTI